MRLSVSVARLIWYLAVNLDMKTLKSPAMKVTPKPAKNAGPMIKLMKTIANVIWYMKKITELKFLGNSDSFAQSTCSRLAS